MKILDLYLKEYGIKNNAFVPKDSEIEKEVMKRPGFDFQQKSIKKNDKVKALGFVQKKPAEEEKEKKIDDSQQQARSSKKRSRKDSDEDNVKKQKLEDDAEKEELRDGMDVVPRDDIAIDVESLATKYPIVDWKTHVLTENMMYYQIIRADGSSKNYKIFNEMLDDFDRQRCMMDLIKTVKKGMIQQVQEGYDLQYMSKTQTDYGSGVARPKIEEKDSFELKGQFIKELRENTFSGSDNEDANEHIEKVLKIVDLFHVPNITVDQLMLRVFPISLTGATSDRLVAIQAQLNNLGREIKKVNEKFYAAQVGCEQCKGPHYTTDCPLKEEGKTLEEGYYMQFGGPFQGGGYRATTPVFYQRNNANPSYQERRQSIEDTLRKFISESAKRHEENSNLIKEI
ncbi:DNA-directed DNA polymerase [Tanacetum coccineum]